MQRRSPDVVRSRVLAASDGVLSLGLAIAYLAAGPALHALGPKLVYAVGGVGALIAGVMLLPLLRLRREAVETEAELEPPVRADAPVEVSAGRSA